MNRRSFDLKNAVDERDHALGSQTGPVTLLEYGNFQCIHCGRVYPVFKKIQRLLGDDLHFVFRNFPTVRTHPHAIRAAEAAKSTIRPPSFSNSPRRGSRVNCHCHESSKMLPIGRSGSEQSSGRIAVQIFPSGPPRSDS